MLLVFCPNKSVVRWSIQWSILQGLHFLPSPKTKKSKRSIFLIYSLNPWNSIKLWTLNFLNPIPFHHYALYSVFKHFILNAIILQFTTEMFNSPKHLFFLKQSKNHQCSSSSVNPIYNPHYFHWEMIKNSWTWELNAPRHSCERFSSAKPRALQLTMMRLESSKTIVLFELSDSAHLTVSVF